MKYRALSCLTLLLSLAAAACQPATARPLTANGTARGGAPASEPGNRTQVAAPATQDPPATQSTPFAQASPQASGATAAAAATGSGAAPSPHRRAYYIEIVIFRTLVALGSPEEWAAETGMAPTVTGAEAATGSNVGQLLDLVPPSQYRLRPITAILRGSRDYHVVAHAAWEQTASDWGSNAGFTLQQLGIDVPGLTGEVYFERGAFLHLGMTLDYSIAHPPAGLGAAPGTTFVLKEMRRVRFYQRNYYDNPAFGVIALVLPVPRAYPPGR